MHKQMSSIKNYTIIGLMSGTSLDGLDLVHAKFSLSDEGKWTYKIVFAKTYEYSKSWSDKLKNAPFSNPEKFVQLDVEIATYYAKKINTYLNSSNEDLEIDAIASHGQTIFHQPNIGLTTQLGCGQTLATLTGIKVVSDFRTKDVSLGGQGAPLVPVGERDLFPTDIDAFLNLGGFANITIKQVQTIAFDICPANLLLNQITQEIDLDYDKNGALGKTATINYQQLEKLNKLSYYSSAPPKSLGSEWLTTEVSPKLKHIESTLEKLGTAYSHIATQIASVLNQYKVRKVMITGGGAKNMFLIESIKKQTSTEILLPSEEIIDFKEALVFGFLGVKKLREEVNCLASVTGASRDSSGGVIHNP